MLKSKGGYALVDCKGLDLTGGDTPQTISGLYNSLKAVLNSGKPIICYGCVWGTGVPMSPINTFGIQYDSTTVIMTASTLQVYVTNEDVVTIVNMAEGD